MERKRSSSIFKPDNFILKKYNESQHFHLIPPKACTLITKKLVQLGVYPNFEIADKNDKGRKIQHKKA